MKHFAFVEFRDHLLSWFTQHKRDLPWRKTQDPYAIMVSELMLQQTQVKTVIPYFERFMQRFPTPTALSQASDEALLNAWQGLGYYRRARHLRDAATAIVTNFGGSFPDEKGTIDQLKGVGAYTSAAIASIAFDLPYACVDGNVIRVISRLMAIDDDVSTGATKKKLQLIADQLLDSQRAGDFNQAMMELGATVCTPKRPSCMTCSVNSFCQTAINCDNPATRPFKSKKVRVQKRVFRSLLIASEQQLLLARRPDQGLMAGMWELPTQFEADFQAWEPLFLEKVQHVGRWQTPVVHKFTHIHASYHVDIYRAPRLVEWLKAPDAYAETRWFAAHELETIPITKVLQKVLAKCASKDGLKEEVWQPERSIYNGLLPMNTAK